MADPLRDWHDFYLLIGTAAATLIGLTFVAASVGASAALTAERAANWRMFLTPTVLHFSAVLIVCLIALAPVGASLGALLLAVGIVGIACGSGHWVGMRRRGLTRHIDLADRMLYVRLPIVGYLLLAAASVHPIDAQAIRTGPAGAGARSAVAAGHPQRLGHDVMDRRPQARRLTEEAGRHRGAPTARFGEDQFLAGRCIGCILMARALAVGAALAATFSASFRN